MKLLGAAILGLIALTAGAAYVWSGKNTDDAFINLGTPQVILYFDDAPTGSVLRDATTGVVALATEAAKIAYGESAVVEIHGRRETLGTVMVTEETAYEIPYDAWIAQLRAAMLATVTRPTLWLDGYSTLVLSVGALQVVAGTTYDFPAASWSDGSAAAGAIWKQVAARWTMVTEARAWTAAVVRHQDAGVAAELGIPEITGVYQFNIEDLFGGIMVLAQNRQPWLVTYSGDALVRSPEYAFVLRQSRDEVMNSVYMYRQLLVQNSN